MWEKCEQPPSGFTGVLSRSPRALSYGHVYSVRAVEFSGVNQSSVIPILRGCEVEPAAPADAVHELHPDQLKVDIRGNRQQESG